jgi:hypothetical protein
VCACIIIIMRFNRLLCICTVIFHCSASSCSNGQCCCPYGIRNCCYEPNCNFNIELEGDEGDNSDSSSGLQTWEMWVLMFDALLKVYNIICSSVLICGGLVAVWCLIFLCKTKCGTECTDNDINLFCCVCKLILRLFSSLVGDDWFYTIAYVYIRCRKSSWMLTF